MTEPDASDAVRRVLAALEPDYNLDYWSDDVKPRVGGDLNALDVSGWDALERALPTRPASWRTRLAQALVYASSERATGVLVALARAPEPEVVAAASETLVAAGYQWDPDVALREHLERQLERAAPEHREAISRLAARLPR